MLLPVSRLKSLSQYTGDRYTCFATSLMVKVLVMLLRIWFFIFSTCGLTCALSCCSSAHDKRYSVSKINLSKFLQLYGLNLSDAAFNNIAYNNFMRIYGEPKPINYECLYEIAKHEFSLPSKSPYLKSDFEKIKEECRKHGVTV